MESAGRKHQGVARTAPEMAGKQLELLKEAVP